MATVPSTGPPRGTRSSTRGGIQKRRGGGAGRVDRDGDLVMDASPSSRSNGIGKRPANNPNKHGATRGRPAARGGGGGVTRSIIAAQDKILRHLNSGSDLSSRVSSQRRGSGPTSILKVIGIKGSKAATNADKGVKNALDFLERKAANFNSRRIIVKKSHLASDHTLHVLLSKEDAEDVLKLNGWLFAGSTLAITESQDGWPGDSKSHSSAQHSQETQDLRSRLRDFLDRRYHADRKLLDLSAIGQDPILAEMGAFQDKERAEKTFKALMTISEDIFPTADKKRAAVESISIAHNSIDHVAQVFDIATTFPDLKHLDCSGNLLQTARSMGRWSHHFRHLETLLLNGNPIESVEPAYKEELVKWFPKLQNLSNIQVRTPEEIAAAEAAKAAARPIPIPQHGPDFRDAGRIGEEFLMQFLPLFDSDRPALANMFYDERSNFSVSVVNHAPRDVDEPVPSWQPYLKYSRNLVRITHAGPRVQRLMKGRQTIQDTWKVLPATKHPDLSGEFSKYLVDCHPLPALADPSGQSAHGVDGLLINIHGEFEESDPGSSKVGKRSFSRTFVLGPGAPGGNPIRVVSDMLSLRAWNPIPVAQASAPAEAAPVDQQQQRQQLIAQLSQRTNMVSQYSEMCLDQVGWNLEAALAKFQETRPNLGPEAFINGVPAP
ncbi:mRNA export factor mex67 [Magnaporthiopsis poae ATCC 64411]|uniref:mRNA export factor mex67 n=1 Tax=Magnaporthiopsis poae (strain ATCC 64411 / 73-15) TaxID=644358 RepID=A0A0C4DTE4_MAGP6|nr:mRNA export factor mex67 [Magnaporthiopsis poae ATCC 64411]